MRSSETEKVLLELEAANVFLKWYERTHHVQCQLLAHNQPAKPDVSCLVGKRHVDIEVAHLYGSEQEAMQILGRELTDHTRDALNQLEQDSELSQRLPHALNRILAQKAQKSYDGTTVWLVIRNAHPAWSTVGFEQYRSEIVIPASHPFNKIWLVGDWQARSGVLELY